MSKLPPQVNLPLDLSKQSKWSSQENAQGMDSKNGGVTVSRITVIRIVANRILDSLHSKAEWNVQGSSLLRCGLLYSPILKSRMMLLGTFCYAERGVVNTSVIPLLGPMRTSFFRSNHTKSPFHCLTTSYRRVSLFFDRAVRSQSLSLALFSFFPWKLGNSPLCSLRLAFPFFF